MVHQLWCGPRPIYFGRPANNWPTNFVGRQQCLRRRQPNSTRGSTWKGKRVGSHDARRTSRQNQPDLVGKLSSSCSCGSLMFLPVELDEKQMKQKPRDSKTTEAPRGRCKRGSVLIASSKNSKQVIKISTIDLFLRSPIFSHWAYNDD